MSFCFSDASSVGSEGSTAAAMGGFAGFALEDADGLALEPFDPEGFVGFETRLWQNTVCHSSTWESLLHNVLSSSTASVIASFHPAAMKVSIRSFRASIAGGLRSISSYRSLIKL